MPIRIAWLALIASACVSPLEGTWSGQCDLTSAGGASTYQILTFELGVPNGFAQVQPDWFAAPMDGVVNTQRSGGGFTVTADMGDRVAGFVMTLEGELEEDTLTGTCRTEVADSEVEESGSGELTRQPAE